MYKEKAENTKEFYDGVGYTSWSTSSTDHYHVGVYESLNDTLEEAQKRVVNYISNKVNFPGEGNLLLDIGCGSGLAAIEISQKKSCKIIGINISEKQLQIGNSLVRKKSLEKNVKLLNMDAHSMFFKKEMFDGVYAIESIMHMDRFKIFEQVHNVLKPSGAFTLCDWYIDKKLTGIEKRFLETITLGNYIKKEEYIALYEKYGFKNIEIDDWSQKILPTYASWTTVTDEMKEQIPSQLLKEIETNCKFLTELAVEKLGYLQITGTKE
ncbi:SAM-dependent methyltransferase [Priestia megaterium]